MTFFMTVGSASSCTAETGDHQWPSGVAMLVDIGSIDVEFQRKMREDVRDAAGAPPVGREGRARGGGVAVDAGGPADVGTSLMPPSRPLSGLVRKRIAPSLRTATKAAPRRCGFSAFSPRTGRSSGSPETMARQSSRTGQSMQRGRFGVQIVAPRSIIACAKSPGRSAGTNSSSNARISGLESGNGARIS